MSTDASEWAPAVSGDCDGWVNVHGRRVHFSIRAGRGRPLLLINGFGASMAAWDCLRNRFEMPTIAFDLPGSGATKPTAVPYPMPLTADMVVRLLDELEYGTVDALGVSLGGGIAQQLAFQAPRRVRRLVLAATNYGAWSMPGHPSAYLALLAPSSASWQQMARVGARTYGGRARHDRAWLTAFTSAAFDPTPSLRGHLWQLVTALTWWSLPALPFLTQPTLVLTGDDDPLVPILNGHALAALIPRGRVRIVTGAGHLFLFEQPEQAAAIVSSFLSAP
jgi:pimeloyl-ACP methyl ester carboxylesterase